MEGAQAKLPFAAGSVMTAVASPYSGNWGSAIATKIGKNVLAFPDLFHPVVEMWVFEEYVKLDADGKTWTRPPRGAKPPEGKTWQDEVRALTMMPGGLVVCTTARAR